MSAEDIAGTTATDTPPSGNDADTYGWDAAFAITFAHANSAITASWASVSDGAKNVHQTADDDPSFSIDGVLGPWQLTLGGDGRNVRMLCPFTSGVYKAGTQTFQLANVQVLIEIGMQWVPDPDQFSFVLSGNAAVAAIRADLNAHTIDAALRSAFQGHGHALSTAATATVQILDEEWLITDGATNYYIFHSHDKDNDEFLSVFQFEDAWRANLKALAAGASEDEPAVVIVTIAHNPATGVAAAVLPELLSVWFNSNIAEFNHVFAALDLSPIVSRADAYAWMKPTASSYAVIDEGTPASSVFGCLTMALSHPPSANHQISPFAIPAGCDAGFLISGPMFMQKMLLSGAQAIFEDAPAGSFLIGNDGLTVTNTAELVWSKFMLNEKKRGSVKNTGYSAQLDAKTLSAELIGALEGIGVSARGYSVSVTSAGSQWLLSHGQEELILNLNGNNIDVYEATVVKIAKGQFSMSLVHTYVQIQFVDLLYSYSSDFDVHVNYSENVQLALKPAGSQQVFWFDQVMKNLVVSVTKTRSAITREIVEGAVMAAVSLVALAAPIIEGLSAGAQISEVSEEAGEAVIDAEAFADAEAANPAEAEADDAAAGSSAAEQAGGRLTNIKNAFALPRWKVAGAIAVVVGGLAGADMTISPIIEHAAKKEWEAVPPFDKFANAAIEPYTWPSVPGFTLQSASLAGSLQVGLKVAQI
jgi:Clostridium P-47 protein